MTWPEAKALAHSIDRAARIVPKRGPFWSALGRIVAIVTLGGISHDEFMTRYATTIGPMQAYPESWSSLDPYMVVHESRHTRQARAFGLGLSPWAGLPFMAVAYLLLPLPLVFAWCRYALELDAERAAVKWALATGWQSPAILAERAADFGRRVCGRPYGWAWPWGTDAFGKLVDAG